MTITLKLFATLSKYLPAGARQNVLSLDVAEGASVGTVLDDLGVPRDQVHLALVDGVYVPLDELDARRLKAGETLAVWPPATGG